MSLPAVRNRRRYPRLEVLGRIDGHLMPVDAPLTVIDLSRGGFAAKTRSAFMPGTGHHFRFTTIDGVVVELLATVVHCRLGPVGPDGRHAFVTGFEFQAGATSSISIEVLIEALSAVLVRG